jgi:hypothetical protein
MVKININIQKKDLWLVSAIFVFLIATGLVVAYNINYPGAVPGSMASIHGHTGDEVDGALGGLAFGDWDDVTSVASGGVVQGPASTDGFVLAYQNNVGPIQGFTPSTTQVLLDGDGDAGGGQGTHITMPVKKGDTWRVTSGQSGMKVYWLPVVSGSGGGSTIKTGTYTGTGAVQNINVGFEPDSITFLPHGDSYGWAGYKTKYMPGAYAKYSSNYVDNLVSITSNGFRIETPSSDYYNVNGYTYSYIAMKE